MKNPVIEEIAGIGLEVVRQGKGRRMVTTRDGRKVDALRGELQDLVEAGIMFVGTPDEVTGQLLEFDDKVGGLGNFLMMGHAGHMTHEEACDQITLMAREVIAAAETNRATSRISLLRIVNLARACGRPAIPVNTREHDMAPVASVVLL